jgi:hypothetical protein
MIGPRHLLHTLRAAGVRFGIEGGRLRVRGPASVLTEPVYQQILYFRDSLREIIWTEPATSDFPWFPAAAKREDVSRQCPGIVSEALFRGGVRAQVRPVTASRYSIWFRSGRRWVRHKGSDTPSSDHARRIAEQWFGTPLSGWSSVEPEESV